MKKILLSLLFCFLAGPAFAGYSYYRSITVNVSQVSGGSNLTQFPVLVCANGSGPCNVSISGLKSVSNGGHVNYTDGNDIIFTTDSGCSSLLTWEMENYVASTGEFEAWVTNASTALSASINTTIYMCYGNSGQADTFQSTASNVWDSNYVLVYHLANGSTLSGSNSVASGQNMTVNSGASAGSGQVDGAALLNGSSGYLNTSAFTLSADPTVLTFSAWIKISSAAMANRNTIFSTTPDNASGNWSIEVGTYSSDTNWLTVIEPGYFITYTNVNAYPTDGKFHYITYTRNTNASSAGGSLFIDGSPVTTTAAALTGGNLVDSGETKQIGERAAGSQFFNGTIDELRYSTNVRTNGWIKTEYNNQSNPANFYAVGAEQSTGSHQNLVNGVSEVSGVSLLN